MTNEEYYMTLPHDMSGSMSKNRFRIELLWGISKMLDVYEKGDFTMVFDCACDIELHVTDGFEFYQIKTHSGSRSYTCKKLTTIKGEGSILGKLYVLKKATGNKALKLAIVSNSPLSDDGALCMGLEKCFSELSETEKGKITSALQSELKLDNVDLNNVFFIHTDMNLADPKNEIMGKLVVTFQKIKNCEPTNPNALYRLIYDAVVDKACYEYSDAEYESIMEHKGLTKAEFDKMLDAHSTSAKTGIQQTEEYIDKLSSIREKRAYKKALPNIMNAMAQSRPLKQLEKRIGAFLISNEEELTGMEKGVDLLTHSFHDTFPIEFDNAEKTVFYIIVICRFTEGVYDDETEIQRDISILHTREKCSQDTVR